MSNEPNAVNNTPAAGTAPAAVEPVVTSPEVNVAPEPTAPVEAVDNTAKLQEQVNNLNIAVKQEREARRTESEKNSALEAKFAQSQGIITKLESAFAPEQPTEETPQPGLTAEQLEDFWDKKEAEKTQGEKERQQINLIKTEISELEKEYDGADGKPKYDDDEVIAWQRANGKLNLTPKAAFLEKSHNEIIDYQVKQRLNKKPEVMTVETPGTSSANQEIKTNQPMSPAEMRKAVFEALENSEADLNN